MENKHRKWRGYESDKAPESTHAAATAFDNNLFMENVDAELNTLSWVSNELSRSPFKAFDDENSRVQICVKL